MSQKESLKLIHAQPAIIIHNIAQTQGSAGLDIDPAAGGGGQHLPQQDKLNGTGTIIKNNPLYKGP